MTYGLRTDFQAELFPGSAALLGLADALIELKAVSECGCQAFGEAEAADGKASINLRVDEHGRAVREGAQTEIGGNGLYVALCRKHFMERIRG